MRFAIHLPQYGRAASPDSIASAAQQAELLGFSDVWVSDHSVYPLQGMMHVGASPYLYDPLLALTWAAAATSSIGIGGTLIAVHHKPLWLAHALASLDALSKGRLTVAIGVGWLETEFQALGTPFGNRGRTTDEIIEVIRAAWGDDPVSFQGEFFEFPPLKVQPKPPHKIPVWIAGNSKSANQRAARLGDGIHSIKVTPEQAADAVKAFRSECPDESGHVFSLRLNPPLGWDPRDMDADSIRRERDTFEAAGIQHVVAAPSRPDSQSWAESVEELAQILEIPLAAS